MTFDNFQSAEIIDYLRQAEAANMINQLGGAYSKDAPCCVGAHLANYLGIKDDDSYARSKPAQFHRGADAWAKAIGGNRAHAILLLREAGAGHDPFNAEPWPAQPSEVFTNLAKFEKLPTLENQDFSNCDLRHATLDADFSGSNFRSAKLEHADFSGSRLESCNMRYADCHSAIFNNVLAAGANFQSAQLHFANFSNSTLKLAQFCYAKSCNLQFVDSELYGADFSRSQLTYANFESANLAHADFTNADLKGANFESADTYKAKFTADSVKFLATS